MVYPTYMLYPQNLIYVNLFDVLHRSKGEMLQGKRLKFFWLVTLGIFVYEVCSPTLPTPTFFN